MKIGNRVKLEIEGKLLESDGSGFGSMIELDSGAKVVISSNQPLDLKVLQPKASKLPVGTIVSYPDDPYEFFFKSASSGWYRFGSAIAHSDDELDSYTFTVMKVTKDD